MIIMNPGYYVVPEKGIPRSKDREKLLRVINLGHELNSGIYLLREVRQNKEHRIEKI